MRAVKRFLILIGIFVISACTIQEEPTTVIVKNTIDIERKFETVELSARFLQVENLDVIGIREVSSGKLQVTQLVDKEGDGINDLLLFQPAVAALSESAYEIIEITEEERPESKSYCFSRFVPERTDDYAWENDKVAFRVFGPTAQKMKEQNIEGGTLSSGVDAWLKKVEYPIIDKWYKKYSEETGSYHEDTGEGLDNFHVGASRGVGGIAIKKDSTYYFSKNFVDWRTLTNGPIRTSFYLKYEDWDVDGSLVQESRIISLDYGSNLSKFVVSIEGSNSLAAGLTLHEKDGEVVGNNTEYWLSYWQPHGDSELGTGIVTTKNHFLSFEKYDVEKTDLSNAYSKMKVIENSVTYYAGFSWLKSGQFSGKKEWENYLSSFSIKVNNPLIVSFLDNN